MQEALKKYEGLPVEIIYQDRKGAWSQRHVRVLEVRPDVVKAYCLSRRAPRMFRVESILSFRPVMPNAG